MMLLKMNLVFSHHYHHVSNKINNNNVHFEIRSSTKNNNGGWRGGGGEVEAEARDRVIDFGKYKGKMLGSIPSSYLKWISKNLRAGDSEEWAKLADQVLRDPIYRDRIEWEFVHNLLTGSNSNSSSSSLSVAEILEEISRRFGWDNQDKVGWSKLDFELLGTSKAARIPRLSSSSPMDNSKTILMKEEDTNSPLKEEEQSSSGHGHGHHHKQGQWGRRMERRHRQKLMRSTATATATSSRMTRTETQTQSQSQSSQQQPEEKRIQKNGGAGKALFPGREAFLRRAAAAAQLNDNNNNNKNISYF